MPPPAFDEGFGGAEQSLEGARPPVGDDVVGVLAGGQSDEVATQHLNAMNRMFAGKLPWPLSFSYGRALQQPSLKAWKGSSGNVAAAQAALLHRARMNSLASLGRYTAEEEKQPLAA